MLPVHFHVTFDKNGLGMEFTITSPMHPLTQEKYVELMEVWIETIKAHKKKADEEVDRLKGEGRLVSMGEWKKENL